MDDLIKDPDLNHLTYKDFEHVYEPSEDSFLFMDALKEEKQELLKIKKPLVSLEIGSGSGIISSYLSLLVPDVFCIATDKNPHAVRATNLTFQKNAVLGDVLNTDLITGLKEKLKSKIDVLLFNPPYVPTPPEEMCSSGIEASWAGGERGREVLDRVIPLISDLLRENGLFFLVVIKQNDPEEIKEILKKFGLEFVGSKYRKARNEKLQVLKFKKK